jgi:hypothetical protein
MRIMIFPARFVLFTLLLFCPGLAIAHGYWVELDGSYKVNQPVKVKLFYGEIAAGERMSGHFLDKMKDIRMYLQSPDGEKKELVMKQKNDYWEGAFVPTKSGTYELTGINDTREVQDWTKHNLGIVRPIQYLKACYAIGAKPSGCASSLPLDAEWVHTGTGDYNVTVRYDDQAVPSQQTTVGTFGGENKYSVTDSAGKAKVTFKKPGLYILSIELIDKTPGTFQGKAYETVRRRLDYSIYHQ